MCLLSSKTLSTSLLLWCLLSTSLLLANKQNLCQEDTQAILEQVTDPVEELRAAFAPLIGKSWRADGKWADGTVFAQEVRFEWDLERSAVIARSNGFVDGKQEQWGQRNHGIRYYDQQVEEFRFAEYDVFGGVTPGLMGMENNSIYYIYNYGGTDLVDAWEMVDENTYNYTVGTMTEDGSWETIFLQTQFVNQAETEDVMIPTDMSLPYREIPDYPDTYNAGTVAARMVDGLGFRYYWATEGLRQADLDYKTTLESRTSAETLDHIYGLVNVVHNAVMEKPNIRPAEPEDLTYAEKRVRTLQLLKAASDKLRESTGEDLEHYDVIFQRGDRQSSSPFWNNLNGPLADAIWHVGQVVAFRRASGNPFNSKVSVFSGKVRE